MRLPRGFALASLGTLFLAAACGGDDAQTGGPGAPQGGSAGKAGAAGSGASVGGSGGKAGASGARAGAAGSGGSAGTAAAGAAGSAAAGASGANAGGGVSSAGASGSTGGTSAQAGKGGAAAGAAAGGGGLGGQPGASGGAGQAGAAGASACSSATCKDGVCQGAVCCALANVCADTCCGGSTQCSFGVCVAAGKPCGDSDDCDVKSFCDFSAGKGTPPAPGTCSGATAPEGKCLPRPPQCAGASDPGAGTTCVQSCQLEQAAIPVAPTLAFSWGDPLSKTDNVMMAPIVIQLDDDDCDKKVTAKDVPEIVFTSFVDSRYQYLGTLHVVTTAGAKNKQLAEKWTADHVFPNRQLAAGNIDGKPGNEVVACVHLDEPDLSVPGSPKAPTKIAVRAYEGATGKVLWTSPLTACVMPAIADLDQDGKPEVIVNGAILEGATGKVKAAFQAATSIGNFAVSDADGDGKLDVVTGTAIYKGDGKLLVTLVAPHLGRGSQAPAIADLDRDGIPEIITAQFNDHVLLVWHWDPKTKAAVVIRSEIDINKDLAPGNCTPEKADRGGGPATAGDFDDDGYPDVALAGGVAYAVFSGAKLMNVKKPFADAETFLWAAKTQDCSSASTGSSLFDFDGDGKAEVAYGDETTLRVYEGATGKELFQTCNTNGTLQEYPVIADVDADGHADLVVVSNSYSGFKCTGGVKTTGVRVFTDPRWVRTRRVWNEHAYSITNVEEDGTIPKVEKTNWKDPALNNFRQNKQPGGELSAPDAIVSLSYPVCSGPYVIKARVTNVGEAPLPAGVVVGLHTGAPTAGPQIATAQTTGILYPAQSETVDLAVADAALAASLAKGSTPYFVVVDDTKIPHPAWTECRTDNNVTVAQTGSCSKD